MASDVLSALELEKESLNTKLILIKEMSGSEAFFINSCLISKQNKDKGALVLVLLHNTFNHYHNVGLKLGYNLKNLSDMGFVKSIDCLDIVNDEISNKDDPTAANLLSDKKSLNKITDEIEKAINDLLECHLSVCLIIDDISGFLDLGFDVNEINLLVQRCRKYLHVCDNFSFVASVHVISENDPSFVLAGLISHLSDVVCEVSALKTGKSRDVSGVIDISRPWINALQITHNLVKLSSYHYKLFDRGIKVFAPGTRI